MDSKIELIDNIIRLVLINQWNEPCGAFHSDKFPTDEELMVDSFKNFVYDKLFFVSNMKHQYFWSNHANYLKKMLLVCYTLFEC